MGKVVEYGGDNDSSQTNSHGSIGLFKKLLLLLALCVLGLLGTFLLPVDLGGRPLANRAKCASNLRILGIAAILYSNDFGYFPHMTDADKEHSEENIPDVFRTLMQGRYLDSPEPFLCPSSSESFPLSNHDAVPKDAKEWDWNKAKTPGVWAIKEPSQIRIYGHPHLSYTYRKTLLERGTTRSDSILAADKTDRLPKAVEGHHVGGYNAVFSDGHVRFIEIDNEMLIKRLYSELRMKTDKHPH